MNQKEKLIEIINNVIRCDKCGIVPEWIAEDLIFYGVTVQEWIPAEEPPEEYRDEYGELIPFLVCEEGTDYPFRAMYDGKTWGDGIFAVPVKWWMHLPAPPKEKERKNGDDNV